MRRLLYLATLSLVASLLFAPAAMAQLTENCPPGSVQNAAGTTCTDLETGEIIINQPLASNPDTDPCPEFFALQEDGTCAPIIDPATGEPYATSLGDIDIEPADPTATPDQYAATDQYTPAEPEAPATTDLPETGGSALLLPAAGLLLATGLIGMRMVRRRS